MTHNYIDDNNLCYAETISRYPFWNLTDWRSSKIKVDLDTSDVSLSSTVNLQCTTWQTNERTEGRTCPCPCPPCALMHTKLYRLVKGIKIKHSKWKTQISMKVRFLFKDIESEQQWSTRSSREDRQTRFIWPQSSPISIIHRMRSISWAGLLGWLAGCNEWTHGCYIDWT